ncbi:MAG: hypothetical protein D4R64_14295 [Porphyromonadaceae bacterium]|nr:MAG: hypothetical protein D4R64_14295 [Porphyromonadaceae bacterium]
MKNSTLFIGLFISCIIMITGCTGREKSIVPEPDQLLTIELLSSATAELKMVRKWEFEESERITATYLFISTGTDNIDKGSTDWGTTESKNFRMIGDYGGEFRIAYENEKVDTIPLVYGYTLWFKNNWISGKEPFLSDTSARKLLNSTIFLNNLYKDDYNYTLRIRLRKSKVKSIDYFDNQLKEGYLKQPDIRFDRELSGKSMAGNASAKIDTTDEEGFFINHTIDTLNTYPPVIKNNLRRLMHLLYTFKSDYQSVASVDIPPAYKGPSIIFSGEPEADIISSVFHYNLSDQVSRVDPNGIVHESTLNAPSWFYDGFGTWTNTIGENNSGSYYDCYYTRNKTIMILPDLNYFEESNRALDFLDKQLMYFPEMYPSLQLGGEKIPGHWTVIANKPLVYSHVLTGVGWPTQYTHDKFGSHYKDFGNPETDGQGHSMISHWKVWQNSGRNKQWVSDKWNYLKEAAEYLTWSFANPGLSFSKYGLLYAESEAGMNDYTLYCNFPCYLGLLMYAEMADSIDAADYSLKWRNSASQLQKSMQVYFPADDSTYGRIWQKAGFYHENILTILKEYYGFDLTNKLSAEWMERSRNTYMKNRDSRPGFYGPKGIGYDHDMLTQTAMLLDKMNDATQWMINLAHLCYSPRLPKPYIVPECASIDLKRGIIRRQGDLGNGFQQAETVNTILLCAGIDDNVPGVLRIMPRLPENWSMRISDYPVTVYSDGKSYTCSIHMTMTYPKNGEQSVTLKTITGGDLKNLNFRLGPFPASTKRISVIINKKKNDYQCFVSGDRAWVWINIPEVKLNNPLSIETTH